MSFSKVMLFVLISTPVFAATDIQMLPPTNFNNTQACVEGGVLFWDTNTAIHCVPGVEGDGAGDLTVNNGNLVAKHQLIVDTTDITNTVVNLANLKSCPIGFYVTSLGGGNFACATVHIDKEPILIPVCTGTGQALQYDGSNFQCATLK